MSASQWTQADREAWEAHCRATGRDPGLLPGPEPYATWSERRNGTGASIIYGLKASLVILLVAAVPAGFFFWWPASLTAACLLFCCYRFFRPAR